MSSRAAGVTGRPCAVCGRPVVSASPRALYCSGACRQRAWRAGATKGRGPARPAGPAAAGDLPDMHAAVAAALAAAGRRSHPAGVAAEHLARALSRAPEAAMPGIARELRACLDAALSDAAASSDPLDDLAAARERRRGG